MPVHHSPSPSSSPLENLHIASPCHASWDAMNGDDRARFCRTCQKNVFNISMMTRAEAEALIREKEGNLCVRFAQREDGTILTNDCPVGWERAKSAALRPWRFLAAGVAAVVVAVVSALGGVSQVAAQPPADSSTQAAGEASTDPSGEAIEQPAVQPTATPQVSHKMGDVSGPAPHVVMGTPPAFPAKAPTCKTSMGGPVVLPQIMGKPAMPSPTPAPTPVIMGGVAPTMGQPVVKHTMGEPAALSTPPKTVKKATKPSSGKSGRKTRGVASKGVAR